MLDLAPHSTIDRLIADAPGDRAAVISPDGILCYREFDSAVSHLAQVLRSRGIEPDDTVAVIVPRSPELVVSIHGILRAGAAYVPIDPEFPSRRIRQLIVQSRAGTVLAGPEYAGLADELGIGRIEPGIGSAESVGAVTCPGDLAYVMYTSGSTGHPKGVEVEHRSVVNRLRWMQRRYPLRHDDVILQKTPVTFDVSVWELMWWAMAGASLALLERGGERDPRTIIAAVQRHRVTIAHFVPSMFGAFLDQLEAQPDSVRRLTSLRTVFCSGEVLTPALVQRFNDVFRPIGVPRLVNLYGPTEATVDVTYFDCPSTGSIDVVPIGRPIDNTTLVVLDEREHSCPVGVPGELNIAGVGLARGYRDRADLTAEAFVTDQRVPGGRRYRTGDLARWRVDGNLEFLGRIDDEVKVRGNRVSPTEVQAAMASCPGLRSAVVAAEPSDTYGTRLIGYFVGASVSVEQLVDHLRQQLPAYMIPTQFTELATLPLTSSGKVDRRALQRPAVSHQPTTAPRNAAETALVDAFAAVLKVDSIGVHDNFFAVGGDSILALAVRSEAEKRGITLDVEDLFVRPTVAELVESTSTRSESTPVGVTDAFDTLPLIDRAALNDAEDAFPATSLQLGMLFHSVERAASTMYKDVFRYRLVMPWREEVFVTAFDRLVERHPALRSTFELTKHSVPVQVVWPRMSRPLGVTAGADNADVERYMAVRSTQRYDVDRAPLYSMHVFILAENVDVVFAFHHALLDGWSVASLMRELLQDYAFHIGLEVPSVSSDRHSATILAEYSRSETDVLASAAAREFWHVALDGAHATSLESHLAHEGPSTAEPHATVLVPPWLQWAVGNVAATRGLPVKSILLAAHCVTLQRLSGDRDITTGLVTHGRPGRTGAESAAGLFLNTVPVRFGDGHATWLDAIEHLVAFERSSHRFRRYPLQAMQSDAGRPLFHTVFDYVDYRRLADVSDVTGITLLGFDTHERTNFALWVTATTDPRDNRLSFRVTGDPAALTATQAQEYAQTLVRVLAAIVRSPDGAVDPAADTLAVGDVAQLIAEQAATNPDAVALVNDACTWSYAELDCGADRIAARLLAAGMPSGARVGVMLDRSPEQIAAVLGVLKAGAAVVPMDVSYPQARLDLMIARAQPFCVLSNSAALREMMTIPVTAALPAIDPGSAAYVLFTSGSTGEPKGVTMPHRALHNIVAWQNRRPSGAVGGSTVQFFPLSFDVSFQEVFSTLCGGGTLRLLSDAQRRDIPALVRLVHDEDIERIHLTCVALQAFAESAAASGARLESLRVVINVGEQLRVTREIRELCSANRFILENQYGPTETHEVASYTLSGPPDDYPTLPPIGTAIDGATIRLLDPDRRPVPRGTKGEIYVGGRCLAIGYEGRADLTAERFVMVGEPGERMYRTGDLGFQLPSGDLVYLGRADTQVKVRGFRIECAEVEFAILGLGEKAIRKAAVVAHSIDEADCVLVAYLVGDSRAVDPAAIRAGLQAVLPAHMVPAHVEWLDDLPLTPSGKRDDKALRERPLCAMGLAREPSNAHPLTAREQSVADIMAEFAGRTAFAATTDFFDAGGTSIGALRVVLAIARTWGVEIPLDSFVAGPTPERLARLIAADGAVRTFDPVVPLRTSGSRPPIFLVHPIGGNVLCYLGLVKHLPSDQPVYALQAAGAEPGATPLRTMGALAESYLEAIRRVHPRGPYHVGGWSFGGYVAVEMARQLADAELAQLILLDTVALADGSRGEPTEKDVLTWFFMDSMWQAQGLRTTLPTLAPDLDRDAMFDAILRHAVQQGLVPTGTSTHLIRRLYETFRANYEATLSYRHEPLDRDILLLRSTERMPADAEAVHAFVGSSFASPTNGWERFQPRSLTVIDVAGDHLSMMSEPDVADVAAKLAAALS